MFSRELMPIVPRLYSALQKLKSSTETLRIIQQPFEVRKTLPCFVQQLPCFLHSGDGWNSEKDLGNRH